MPIAAAIITVRVVVLLVAMVVFKYVGTWVVRCVAARGWLDIATWVIR